VEVCVPRQETVRELSAEAGDCGFVEVRFLGDAHLGTPLEVAYLSSSP
jgi:hypothetical protein